MKFYYFDDIDFIVCGPYSSPEDAKRAVQDEVGHTRTVTILEEYSSSKPPTLKRVWR